MLIMINHYADARVPTEGCIETFSILIAIIPDLIYCVWAPAKALNYAFSPNLIDFVWSVVILD